MYSGPIAYFITFTVRGSWLHGDERGSWKQGGRFVSPAAKRYAVPNQNTPHFLTEEECSIVEKAIEEVCTQHQWLSYEKKVLNDCVQVVLTAPDTKPEQVMLLLKSKATMRLRKAGFAGKDEKMWTQHGSTKYLFDEQALETACEDVQNAETAVHEPQTDN